MVGPIEDRTADDTNYGAAQHARNRNPASPRGGRTALAVQSPLGNQQARTRSTIDEAQAQAGAAFSFTGSDLSAAQGLDVQVVLVGYF